MTTPKTLHLGGEFTEANLGADVSADGEFTFQPRCILLPANRRVTLRFATPDVIHGIRSASRRPTRMRPCS